uniref:Uncharacterized protein n=1 Tax=Siphoviridae sp. ctBLh2 TaxID=2827803 RepID=A0A8S5S363_9CAUD|nr:MAG TPA: hypothetical protein [Siphoviridae sp. ctBLh2]
MQPMLNWHISGTRSGRCRFMAARIRSLLVISMRFSWVVYNQILAADPFRTLDAGSGLRPVRPRDAGSAGAVYLELHTPVGGPGGQEVDVVAAILDQHVLQRPQQDRAVVLVGNPVVVGPPHHRETECGIGGGTVGRHDAACFVGQAQVGCEDTVLLPAPALLDRPPRIGPPGHVEAGLAHAVPPVGEYGIEFGLLHVHPLAQLLPGDQHLSLGALAGGDRGQRRGHPVAQCGQVIGEPLAAAGFQPRGDPPQPGDVGQRIADPFEVGLQRLRRREHDLAALRLRVVPVVEGQDARGDREERFGQEAVVLREFIICEHERNQLDVRLKIVADVAVLRNSVRQSRAVPSVVVDGIGSPETHRLREVGSFVPEIPARAVLGQRQGLPVHPEQRAHHLPVARKEHGTVGQARILPPVGTAPQSEVGIQPARASGHIVRQLDIEDRAVELDRHPPPSGRRIHVALQDVGPGQREGLLGLLLRSDEDVVPEPEVVPPLPVPRQGFPALRQFPGLFLNPGQPLGQALRTPRPDDCRHGDLPVRSDGDQPVGRLAAHAGTADQRPEGAVEQRIVRRIVPVGQILVLQRQQIDRTLVAVGPGHADIGVQQRIGLQPRGKRRIVQSVDRVAFQSADFARFPPPRRIAHLHLHGDRRLALETDHRGMGIDPETERYRPVRIRSRDLDHAVADVQPLLELAAGEQVGRHCDAQPAHLQQRIEFTEGIRLADAALDPSRLGHPDVAARIAVSDGHRSRSIAAPAPPHDIVGVVALRPDLRTGRLRQPCGSQPQKEDDFSRYPHLRSISGVVLDLHVGVGVDLVLRNRPEVVVLGDGLSGLEVVVLHHPFVELAQTAQRQHAELLGQQLAGPLVENVVDRHLGLGTHRLGMRPLAELVDVGRSQILPPHAQIGLGTQQIGLGQAHDGHVAEALGLRIVALVRIVGHLHDVGIEGHDRIGLVEEVLARDELLVVGRSRIVVVEVALDVVLRVAHVLLVALPYGRRGIVGRTDVGGTAAQAVAGQCTGRARRVEQRPVARSPGPLARITGIPRRDIAVLSARHAEFVLQSPDRLLVTVLTVHVPGAEKVPEHIAGTVHAGAEPLGHQLVLRIVDHAGSGIHGILPAAEADVDLAQQVIGHSGRDPAATVGFAGEVVRGIFQILAAEVIDLLTGCALEILARRGHLVVDLRHASVEVGQAAVGIGPEELGLPDDAELLVGRQLRPLGRSAVDDRIGTCNQPVIADPVVVEPVVGRGDQ